jgi:hypothetical protein
MLTAHLCEHVVVRETSRVEFIRQYCRKTQMSHHLWRRSGRPATRRFHLRQLQTASDDAANQPQFPTRPEVNVTFV